MQQQPIDIRALIQILCIKFPAIEIGMYSTIFSQKMAWTISFSMRLSQKCFLLNKFVKKL